MIVLGQGRVGGALVARARQRGVEVQPVGREGSVPDTGPILVCTRADDLDAVVARVAPERRADLVFVQNGMLRTWLAERGVTGATRGLLFLAVPARGAPLSPGGPSPFCGQHAAAVVAWLTALDVPAREVAPAAFAVIEAEKLLWNTVYGLLSEVLGVTVGEVADAHGAEAAALAAELTPLLVPALGVPLDPAALAAGMAAYSRSIAGWRGAVKEWRWRNGWFVAAAERAGVATPVHDGWLARWRSAGGRT